MSSRYLLLCASIFFLAACSGTMEDDLTQRECDDSHGCPNGLSCVDHVCVGADGSIGNDEVQASGEASGAPATVEVETGECKGPTCKIAAGSDVVFRAPVVAGYRFTGWSGDPRCTGSEPELMLTNVDANIRCVANYVKRVVIAGTSASPGASVSAMSGADFAQCEGGSCEVDQGSTVTLTASALSGHRFAGFAGDGCEQVTGSVATVVAPADDVSCTANYVLVHTVTGNVDGGSAQVMASSDAAGANCNANTCSIDAGASVTLTAPASAGFRFTGWSGSEGCAGATPVLTLNGIASNVLCTAHYMPRFIVAGSIVGPSSASSLLAASSDAFASCSEGSCEVDRGSDVTLTAQSIVGYAFAGFSGDDACANYSGGALLLEDVERDISCVATYVALPPGSVNIVGNISGAPGAISAAPEPPCASGSCVITEGSDVTLTAPDLAPNYRFLGWRGATVDDEPACVGSALTLVLEDVATNLSCVAGYVPRYVVTGATGPDGGVVEASSTATNAVCDAGSCAVDSGESATLTAVPASGYRFGTWTGGGLCSGTSPTLQFADVTSSVTCTAHFIREFAVTYSAGTGGTVSSSKAVCPFGSPCTVDTGTNLAITAAPSAGYRFGSWSGSGCTDTAPGTPLVANLNVTTNVSCTASFVRQVTVSFQVPQNGTVTSSNVNPAANSSCTGTSCTFDSGGSIHLTATPNANTRFVAWSGCSTSTDPQLDLTNVTSDTSCLATFMPRVTVSFADPAGGSVAASDATPAGSASCNSTSCTLDQGGSVRLTATADSGYRFVAWSGCSTSPNAVLDLSNITANTSCTATFVQRWTVAGGIPDAPAGVTVTAAASQPAPHSTCTNPAPGAGSCVVDQGLTVTLTASAVANTTITGWTGTNCGAGTLGNGNSTLTFSNVSANASCTPVYSVTVTIAKTPDTIPNSVQISAPGCPANGSACTVPAGTTVTLSVGSDRSGTFQRWTGSQCNSSNAGLSFAATRSQTCTAEFTGYWAMLYSHGGAAEQYNASVQIRDTLYAVGHNGGLGRVGEVDPASGAMLDEERMQTVTAMNLTWYDASAFKSVFAAVGRYASRTVNGSNIQVGGEVWLRRGIVSEKSRVNVNGMFTEASFLKERLFVTGYTAESESTAAAHASVLAADLTTLVDPAQEAALHIAIAPADCETKEAFSAAGRGVAPAAAGIVLVTQVPDSSMDLWFVRLTADLQYVDNLPFRFNGKLGHTDLMIEEVLPTPEDGGFLLVGSLRIGDVRRALVIKVADDLTQEWGFYMAGAKEGDDYFTGAAVLKSGEYVVVGSTQLAPASGAQEGWFLRLDKEGTVVRSLRIGTASAKDEHNDEFFTDVRVANDGGLHIAGTRSSVNGKAAWLLHTTDNGEVVFNAEARGHITAHTTERVAFGSEVGKTPLCYDYRTPATAIPALKVSDTRLRPTEERQAW